MSASLAGASPQNWFEEPFNPGGGGTYPVDCSATPNNNRALVRYANPSNNSPILGVWRLTSPYGVGSTSLMAQFGGGFTLKSGNQTTLSPFNLRAYQPSDRVEVTNSFGVSIGSGDSGNGVANDETYIELTDMSSSPALLTQIVVSSSSQPPLYDYDHAGLANDLAITRDSEWAVVNCDNWIHLIYTATLPSSWVVYDFNIGDIDYSQSPPAPNFNSPCSPNLAVDSVAVTNDRAVVTTARRSGPGNTPRTWVYIIDLTQSPPVIVLQHELVPTGWTPDEFGDRPHDVAITIGRTADRLAVVTTTHGAAAFDLSSNVQVGPFHFDATESRRYQQQVDSVEVTDDRAVVISDATSAGTTHWKVEVFSVNTGSGLTSLVEYKPTGTEPPPSRAHDLAIDKDLDIAVIRTSNDNVIVSGLTGTLAKTVLASPNGSNAFEYEAYATNFNYDVFSSDAVVICPAVIVSENPTVVKNMAVTIGGYFDSNTLKWVGAVDVIDLAATTLSVSQVAIVPNALDEEGCVPVDLAINFDHDEVVIRSVNPYQETSPATGPDLVQISLLTSPSAITASYGGSGTVMGLDSLCVQPSGFVSTSKRILSISQEELNPTGVDYTHRNK